MARKDELLKSFLEHDLIKSKYGITKSSLPKTVREGMQSELPIVKAISIIIGSLEAIQPVTDTSLRNSVLQYLNDAAL